MTIKNKQAWLIAQTEKLTKDIFKRLDKELLPITKDYKKVYQNCIISLTELNNDFLDSNGNIINENLYFNRLQQIRQQVGRELTTLVYKHDVEINKILEKYHEEVIKTQINNLQAVELHTINISASEFANLYPYHKYSFMKNLQNTVFFVDKKLNELLTINVIKGSGYVKVASEIKKAFNTADYIAKRIARTELSRVYNNANLSLYKAEGSKKVKWLDSTERAVGKSKVCEHCRKIASKNNGIYLIGEVPVIPQHPHCRCTIAPVVEFKDGTTNWD